jgi:hypothetical protein
MTHKKNNSFKATNIQNKYFSLDFADEYSLKMLPYLII